MSAEAALKTAKDAKPAPVSHIATDADPLGLRPGTAVTVTPDDNAKVPVAGTLVAADAREIVVHRNDSQTGDIHLHFPRAGFER
jgi:glutathione S-transferase